MSSESMQVKAKGRDQQPQHVCLHLEKSFILTYTRLAALMWH